MKGWKVHYDAGYNVEGEKTIHNEDFGLHTEIIKGGIGKNIEFYAMKGWQKTVVGKINKRIPVRKRAYNSLLKEVKSIISKSLADKKIRDEYKEYLRLDKKYW